MDLRASPLSIILPDNKFIFVQQKNDTPSLVLFCMTQGIVLLLMHQKNAF